MLRERKRLLEQAFGHLQASNIEQAEQLADQAFQLMPRSPEVLNLMALIKIASGDNVQAEQYFEQSLGINPAQPQVLSKFGNFLMSLGRLESAENHCKQAVRLQPTFLDAQLNYIRCLSRRGLHEEAVEAARNAIEIIPNNVRLYTTLGVCLKESGSLEKALVSYDQALSIDPNDFFALHNKGVALRMLQRPNKALECYDQILAKGAEVATLRMNRGCALYDAGRIAEAEEELCLAIRLSPEFFDAHRTVNKLYWEHGDDEKFLRSYEVCIDAVPESVGLRMEYAVHLVQAGRDGEAEQVIQKAVNDLGEHHSFLHTLGSLAAYRADYEKAKSYYFDAISEAPEMPRYRLDMANMQIREDDYAGAMDQVDVAEKYIPDNQEVWAYKGICWRLQGDDRYHWLNDYDRFVQAKVMDTPAGYDNFEHFMHELRTELIAQHKTGRHPLDQSVRYGTQTTSFLLNAPIKVIQDYKLMLERRVREYLASLPDDPTHPFLRRKRGGFVFSGSWSVRLKNHGYHVNHIHPEGWMSGPTYIEVPKVVRSDDPSRGGWVKFGETCLDLGPSKEYVAKAVCPEPGLIAFFPSYVWHGTYPFESDEHRMTTPCDIMPTS